MEIKNLFFFGNSHKQFRKKKLLSIINNPYKIPSNNFMNYGYDYFDNNLVNSGYAKYVYDGRFKKPAHKIEKYFNLKKRMKICEFGCAKGYLLFEFLKKNYKIMEKYNIPTAKSKIFSDYDSAIKYLNSTSDGSLVVKADGLAAGKGVFLSEKNAVLKESIKDLMIENKLGDSGKSILLSERLSGFEVSVFGFVSGENISDLIVACDYKRVFDNDKGPNTGGMGAYSTPEILNHELLSEIKENIFKPIASGLVNEQKPYYGILYAGLMITDEGPKVIEFNCRFGDPECQIIMSRIDSDLLDIFLAVANKEPANFKVNKFSSIGIVLTSGGYPDRYKINFPIKGLHKISNSVSVFHSGTDFDSNGNYITNGGRVITLVATSDSLESSRLECYENITNIEFENMYYRKDIGKVLRSCDK